MCSRTLLSSVMPAASDTLRLTLTLPKCPDLVRWGLLTLAHSSSWQRAGLIRGFPRDLLSERHISSTVPFEPSPPLTPCEMSYTNEPNKSLQPTRDGAPGISRSRRLADVTSPEWLSSGRSSGTRSRNRRILYKAGVILRHPSNAVRPAAQVATWSGGPDGLASGCHGQLVDAGLSDARVRGRGCLATLGWCLKNRAVDPANVPANRQRAPQVIPTLLAMPLAGTFAGHRSRSAHP